MMTGNSYGHGVLRSPDPRFIALQNFCDAHPELEESSIIRLVKKVVIGFTSIGISHRYICPDLRSRSWGSEGARQGN